MTEEAGIEEEDQDRLLAMLRKKALDMDTMDRAQLLAFIKTLLSVRNCLLEKEQEHGVEMMQEMARRPQAAGPGHHRLDGGERVGGRAPQESHQGGRGGPWLCGEDAGSVLGQHKLGQHHQRE